MAGACRPGCGPGPGKKIRNNGRQNWRCQGRCRLRNRAKAGRLSLAQCWPLGFSVTGQGPAAALQLCSEQCVGSLASASACYESLSSRPCSDLCGTTMAGPGSRLTLPIITGLHQVHVWWYQGWGHPLSICFHGLVVTLAITSPGHREKSRVVTCPPRQQTLSEISRKPSLISHSPEPWSCWKVA